MLLFKFLESSTRRCKITSDWLAMLNAPFRCAFDQRASNDYLLNWLETRDRSSLYIQNIKMRFLVYDKSRVLVKKWKTRYLLNQNYLTHEHDMQCSCLYIIQLCVCTGCLKKNRTLIGPSIWNILKIIMRVVCIDLPSRVN